MRDVPSRSIRSLPLRRVLRHLSWAFWLTMAALTSSPLEAAALHVIVYKGGFATVNSYIFSNGKSLIVMDVQRKAYEAQKLADLIREQHLPLTHILISHGHTDHFTGMALLHQQFPKAEIVVASADIKRDIKEYALYMDSGGATGAEPALDPALRPRSAANPGGFDYEGLIHVIHGRILEMEGGGTLELTANYPPTEAKHMTTVYCRSLNALFLADLAYNKVHLWLGDDITLDRIATWRTTVLSIKEKYALINPAVYPGHGEAGDLSMLEEIVGYMDDFTRIVGIAGSREEAWSQMDARYPDYKEKNFFLKYSVENHVK